MKQKGVGLGLAGLAVVAALWIGRDPKPAQTVAAGAAAGDGPVETVAVTLPDLTGDAAIGQKVFAANCASCHGPRAGGIDGSGPPLVHAYYVPGHHGDAAFFSAAERGVRAHHWPYGDMPPISNVTRAEVAAAIAFVRKVQRENGIF
ncbi:MAG TPA: cytochrome c [Rhodobacterales bacterium]|nr:cytochrome c [Rhodobacterales bacterium]